MFLQVLMWSKIRGKVATIYDILRSNISRTFYQRLDIRPSVVDVWQSLVHFLCFIGSCSTAQGLVGHQPPVVRPLDGDRCSLLENTNTRPIAESSVTNRWLLFLIHYACSCDAKLLAAEDIRDDRLNHYWRWTSVLRVIVISYTAWYPCFVYYIVLQFFQTW